jgi:hypothetical protein
MLKLLLMCVITAVCIRAYVRKDYWINSPLSLIAMMGAAFVYVVM